jgi:glycosyltransferase involved in cell wall biosynthesis
VELSVKVFEDCQLPASSDPRVVYHRRFIPQHEFVEWYKSLNCFISLTKGEGWGLHIQQAMACARPVITMRASGQSEYITENNALCCRFKWEEPDWSVYKGFGQWCIADLNHASELMRYLYENNWKGKEVAKVAAKAAARYTWERFSDGIESVLKEFGRL